jgi:SpoVK/Ycf46/Vps4 family AAA+-type ATPase
MACPSNEKAPFVIVATGRPADLNEAFVRRLPHKVLFSFPTMEQLREIFKVFLNYGDLGEDVSLDLLAFEYRRFLWVKYSQSLWSSGSGVVRGAVEH